MSKPPQIVKRSGPTISSKPCNKDPPHFVEIKSCNIPQSGSLNAGVRMSIKACVFLQLWSFPILQFSRKMGGESRIRALLFAACNSRHYLLHGKVAENPLSWETVSSEGPIIHGLSTWRTLIFQAKLYRSYHRTLTCQEGRAWNFHWSPIRRGDIRFVNKNAMHISVVYSRMKEGDLLV